MSNVKLSVCIMLILFTMCNVSSAADDYYLNVSGPDEKLSDNLTIYAGEIITIKILDSDGKEFEGSIMFYDDSGSVIKPDKTKEQKPDDYLEKVKNILLRSNKTYLLEKSFEDKNVDRIIIITGQVNGTYPTKNNVTINILTNDCTIKFGDNELTIRKDNSHKVKLEKNFEIYQTQAEILKTHIDKFDMSGDAQTFEPIEDVSQSYNVIKEILAEESVINEAKNNEIENIKSELDSTYNDLLDGLNNIAENIKVKKVSAAQENVTNLKNDYRDAKTDLRSSTFYPAGLLIFIGIIGGILNVQRWKKNEIYLKMYSKKAKVANPVMISIIISVVLIMIMLIALFAYGDFKIFTYLI